MEAFSRLILHCKILGNAKHGASVALTVAKWSDGPCEI